MVNMADRLTREEQEEYEERAAIMEFEGNIPRGKAEIQALDEITKRRIRKAAKQIAEKKNER
jgi:predicted ATP-binding protein involved in virulence